MVDRRQLLFDPPAVPPANGSCPGNLTTLTCELRPAVLNYTVVQTNRNSETKVDQKQHVDPKKNKHGQDDSQSERSLADLDVLTQLDFSCDWLNEDWCGLRNESWRQLAGIEVRRNADLSEEFTPGGTSVLEGFLLWFKTNFEMKVLASYNGSAWTTRESGL
jgi:hypothetical protein